MTTYFRRSSQARSGRLFPHRSRRYEIWVAGGTPKTVSFTQLDKLLDARRFPADFWAAVNEADRAFESGERTVWVEAGTGRRVVDPPTS